MAAQIRVARRLAEAVEAAGLDCDVFGDGISVRVDADTIGIPDPVIVVELVSPSRHKRDSGSKLADYFRLPSVRQHLIVKTETRAVIHHARDAAGAIATRIIREVPILLDPPEIELTGIFP